MVAVTASIALHASWTCATRRRWCASGGLAERLDAQAARRADRRRRGKLGQQGDAVPGATICRSVSRLVAR